MATYEGVYQNAEWAVPPPPKQQRYDWLDYMQLVMWSLALVLLMGAQLVSKAGFGAACGWLIGAAASTVVLGTTAWAMPCALAGALLGGIAWAIGFFVN